MKTEIKVKLSEGAELPRFKLENSSSFDIKVNNFKKLFKGKKEMDMAVINQNSIARGYFILRPFERLVIGTGISMALPTGMAIQIDPNPKYVLHPGFIAVSTTVDASNLGEEILVTLYNPCQFLSKVSIGDIIALGTIIKYEQAIFID